MMRVEICWLEVLVEDLLIAMPLLILSLIMNTFSMIWFLGHFVVQGTASPIIGGGLQIMDVHIDLHHQVSIYRTGAYLETLQTATHMIIFFHLFEHFELYS